MKKQTIRIAFLFCAFFSATNINAQKNLLLNPNADSKSEHWKPFKEEITEAYSKCKKVNGCKKDYLLELLEQKSVQAAVEDFNGDNVFVVRNKGYFYQDVNLSESDVGKFALLIGRGSSERVNMDGVITGLPYLYGYMLNTSNSEGRKILTYLQSPRMLGASPYQDEWMTMFGIFQVPEGASAIRFFLKQAERKDVPQNGSAARFDNLGLYLFETEKDALEFIKQYK